MIIRRTIIITDDGSTIETRLYSGDDFSENIVFSASELDKDLVAAIYKAVGRAHDLAPAVAAA